MFCAGYLSDCAIKRDFGITSIRRICNTIGFWGAASTLFGLCFFTAEQRSWAIVLLLINSALTVWGLGGFGINLFDLSPHYTSITVTISETLGTIFSFVSTLTWGIIVTDMVNIFLKLNINYLHGKKRQLVKLLIVSKFTHC